jgi:tetratricopeptide (TPR) repeat protein
MTSSRAQCSQRQKRRVFGPRARGLVVLLSALCAAAMTSATPYVPSNDTAVLAQVSGAEQLRELQPMRRALAANPDDVAAALVLARAYLDIGRRDGDPRFLSYSQATLARWTSRADAPVETLTLGAIALQSLHRFDDSLGLLQRAVDRDPRNAQAWLTQATVFQVRGQFAAARRSCTHLIGITDQAVALACLAGVNGMNGKLRESYVALASLAAQRVTIDSQVSGWLLGLLGDMSVRLGNDAGAQLHYEAALKANPDDVQVRAELADLLLRQRRATQAIELLQAYEAQDPLLLRLAIAGKQLRTRQGERWIAMYDARFQAAQRDDDATHLREHARYLLEVRGDAAAALKLAERNWQIQREPADIRVYWQAATNVGAATAIEKWITDNRYQDATLGRRDARGKESAG